MSSGSPAGAQPPLPTPEYLAESLAPTIRGVLWTSVVVPLVFVLLRCYARYMVRKVFALDDWFILLAMVRIPYSPTIRPFAISCIFLASNSTDPSTTVFGYTICHLFPITT